MLWCHMLPKELKEKKEERKISQRKKTEKKVNKRKGMKRTQREGEEDKQEVLLT